MLEVAVIAPVVENVADAILIPFPPLVPPKQEEKVTSPLPVKPPTKFTPWLIPVLQPVPDNVMSAMVPEVHDTPILIPLDPATVARLVPDKAIVPVAEENGFTFDVEIP